MVCPRCGAAFEGNFCPWCGTPATPASPRLTFMVTCPRCGTLYEGHFCPRCGLPAGAVPPAAAQGPSGVSPDTARALSVLWTLALVGFLLFVALNFAGLLISPASVVPGIQGISSGESANQALTAGDADWTFQALNGSAATGTYVGTGGNPGGYLETTLPPGSQVGGEWVQGVQLTGSAPFVAEVQLDYRASVSGRLVIAVDTAPSGLSNSSVAIILPVNASDAWNATEIVDVSNPIGEPGTYYLKVGFLATDVNATALVGFDNIRMVWATNAAFYFYLPLPFPPILFLLYLSQDPGQFLAYYVFIVAALVASGLWYSVRERKQFAQAFRAPLERIGARLRSPSAWVSVAQVWLATTFFQAALIVLLELAGASPSSPFVPTTTNAWTLLFSYSAASVFEELAFRMFLIGVPMALAAFLFRAARIGTPAPAGPAGTRRKSALRYLWGGQLRRDSSPEARLAAAVLIVISAFLFGLAHAPGWGWWKVLPAFVLGLGVGYVFVRHGIGASILVHFATDGSLALTLEGIGGVGLAAFTDLFYIGLAIAGSGFFAWYVFYAWEEIQALRRSFRARIVRQPAAVGNAPAGWGYAPPPTGAPGPAYSSAPPPAASPPPPPPPTWTQAPSAAPHAARPSMQLPQGYLPTYHPPPYGYPPVRFQCPFCGWVEARYENRTFTCLRCGRTA